MFYINYVFIIFELPGSFIIITIIKKRCQLNFIKFTRENSLRLYSLKEKVNFLFGLSVKPKNQIHLL